MRKLATLYLLGLLTFYFLTAWDIYYQTYIYYLWDKGKDSLMWYVLMSLMKGDSQKFAIKIFWLSFIRFIGELFFGIFGYDINTIWFINTMFVLTLSIILCGSKALFIKKR